VKWTWCSHPPILDEYRRVGADLAIRHAERAAALAPVLTLLAMSATIVDAPPLAERVSDDPAMTCSSLRH